MTYTYKIEKTSNDQDLIIRIDENEYESQIPTWDASNSDYQAYLATLAANSAPQANSTES
jgi:hypothetical protein